MLSIGGGLCAPRRNRAEPRLHHRKRFGGGEDMLMPRPRVVRMAISDDGAVGPAIGIDRKLAGPEIQVLRVNGQPRDEVIRSHCGTFVWNKSRFLLPILELQRVAR